MNRYPAGSKHRWESVANYMNDSLKPQEPFTPEECSKKAHEAVAKMSQNVIESKAAKEAVKESTAIETSSWTQEQQKSLEKGLVAYPSGSLPIAERWEKIANDVEGKTAKECLAQFKELCAKLKNKK